MSPSIVIAYEDQIAAALTEWERRFREEPEKFQSDNERLAESPETYGEGAAKYLIEILGEQRETTKHPLAHKIAALEEMHADAIGTQEGDK